MDCYDKFTSHSLFLATQLSPIIDYSNNINETNYWATMANSNLFLGHSKEVSIVGKEKLNFSIISIFSYHQ
jgi:hypothetical protein